MYMESRKLGRHLRWGELTFQFIIYYLNVIVFYMSINRSLTLTSMKVVLLLILV